ncbi:unnamed protein product, partial [Amoebophrya sp. A25]
VGLQGVLGAANQVGVKVTDTSSTSSTSELQRGTTSTLFHSWCNCDNCTRHRRATMSSTATNTKDVNNSDAVSSSAEAHDNTSTTPTLDDQ